MSIVAEFTIPAEALPARELLIENPEMRIEVERIVPTRESLLPFFWVWGAHPETFKENAEWETAIAEIDILERVDDSALFRAE